MIPILANTGSDLVTLTPHGLHFNGAPTYEQWRDYLDSARKAKDCYYSILSDITAYGRRNFGDEKVNEALEQMEFDMAECTKAEFISLVTIEQRTEHGLTGEHAYILGKFCETAEQREEWAAKTREHSLTAFELKKSIEKGEVIHAAQISENSGHGHGIPSVQAVHFSFLKWQRQFEDRASILSLPAKEREKILGQLTPMVELAAELESSLSSKK